MIILLVTDNVVLLRHVLMYMIEHTDRICMIYKNKALHIEGNDIFQICTLRSTIPIATYVDNEHSLPIILDIIPFLRLIQNNSPIYMTINTSAVTIRGANISSTPIIPSSTSVPIIPFDIVEYTYIPILYNNYVRYNILTSDFSNSVMLLCLGNGMFDMNIIGKTCIFKTYNEYGHIDILTS